jgi:hypothetical protein
MKTLFLILSLALGSFLICNEDSAAKPGQRIEEISAPGTDLDHKSNEQNRIDVYPVSYDSTMRILVKSIKNDRC